MPWGFDANGRAVWIADAAPRSTAPAPTGLGQQAAFDAWQADPNQWSRGLSPDILNGVKNLGWMTAPNANVTANDNSFGQFITDKNSGEIIYAPAGRGNGEQAYIYNPDGSFNRNYVNGKDPWLNPLFGVAAVAGAGALMGAIPVAGAAGGVAGSDAAALDAMYGGGSTLGGGASLSGAGGAATTTMGAGAATGAAGGVAGSDAAALDAMYGGTSMGGGASVAGGTAMGAGAAGGAGGAGAAGSSLIPGVSNSTLTSLGTTALSAIAGGKGASVPDLTGDEAARQAKQQAAIDAINERFGYGSTPTATQNKQARDSMYSDISGAVSEAAMRDLNKQFTTASNRNTFGLARSGLLGGSVDAESGADLQDRYGEGKMKATQAGLGAASDLRSQDEQTRQRLVSLAQSGLDVGTANSMAGSEMQAAADSAKANAAGTSVGRLFDDMAQAYNVNSYLKARYPNGAGAQYTPGMVSNGNFASKNYTGRVQG